jgi:hypothetical protein
MLLICFISPALGARCLTALDFAPEQRKKESNIKKERKEILIYIYK